MLTPVEEIKARLDIADVVQGYIKLQRAGANFKATCPFHAEKTPSFFVSPERQTWHCFGCNIGGDMFSFVERIEGVEFKDALRLLARRAGVTLTPPTPEAKKSSEAKTRIAEANELSCQFFETQLARSRQGNAAKVYLKSRGVNEETIRTFRIGFAPYTPDGLTSFLRTRGYLENEMVSAGLAIADKGYGIKDRFRGRIMFPISDRAGRVLGFSGRIFGRQEQEYDPKYLNTSQTPLFDKSRVLFGLAQATPHIRPKNTVILVEGQMDCVLSHQVGVANTVATSGTALTSFQLRLLKRLADTLVMAFDADSAGEAAARRGVDLALQEGFMVKAVAIDAGKDPADFIRQDPDLWKKRVEEPMPVILFFLDRLISHNDVSTAEGKRLVGKEILPLVAQISNAIERGHLVSEIARRLHVREETIWEELSRLVKEKKHTAPSRVTPENAPIISSRREKLEVRLLATLLLVPQAPEEVNSFEFSHGALQELAAALQQNRGNVPEHLGLVFEPVLFLAEELKSGEIDAAQELLTCLRELNALVVRERLETLTTELEDAEHAGDIARIEKLGLEVQEHSRKLGNILGKNLKSVA